MRLLHFGFICLWLAPGAGAAERPASDYAVTLTGTYTIREERIDLGIPGDDPHTRPGPLYLAFTNLGLTPVTYTFHSTGPTVKWEFEVNGTVYTCTTMGEGSGINASKMLRPRESGVIPTDLYYGQIPEGLRTIILAPDKLSQTFVDAKVRVSLSIEVTSTDARPKAITVTSDWSLFRVGSPNRPKKTATEQPVDGNPH